MKENSNKIVVDILLNGSGAVPKQHSEFAAGYDIYSANQTDITIKSNSLKLIPTGISISIPAGYEAQIRPRSGLALKHQIGVLNSPGTIDSDYRGEIGIILYNFGEIDFVVRPNMRIAQMVIAKHEIVDFNVVENLDETVRGINGFGHTKY